MPAEIYLPESFLGRPLEVDREAISGRVKDYFGTTMDTDESYICDRCNQPFNVHAKVQFVTYGTNFKEDYKTTIKKKSLFLQED